LVCHLFLLARLDLLLSACFQPGTALLKSRLNIIHNAKLAIRDFAMRGHGPEKSYAMARHGNIRVISAWHQHDVSISHNTEAIIRSASEYATC
jgi:hypothetical protein